MSPSSQRAWIEIQTTNIYQMIQKCRPLHRGRGLKYDLGCFDFEGTYPSPSSQRAWIEITKKTTCYNDSPSPSSQRAWIEMLSDTSRGKTTQVALFTEGVD